MTLAESLLLSCVVVPWDWLSLVRFFFYSPPTGVSFAGIKREVAALPRRNEITVEEEWNRDAHA